MLFEENVPNERLRRARHLKAWTQSDLAEAIGTGFETVSRWERGITLPSAYFREHLCRVLEKTPEELGFVQSQDEPLASSSTPCVFLAAAYADAEREFTTQLKAHLQARGMTVLSSRTLRRQETQHQRKALQEAIRASQLILLITSPEARTSRHVHHVLQIAEIYQSQICALWIDGDNLQECFPPDCRDLFATIDARQDNDHHVFGAIIAKLEDVWLASNKAVVSLSTALNDVTDRVRKSEQKQDLERTPTQGAGFSATWVAPKSETLYDPAIPLQPAFRLVGRDEALTYLKQRLLASRKVALTALTGLPGVGKTALAIEVVHDPEILAHFSDGILWAALGPDPNIPGLLSRWGAMLSISSTEMASLRDDEAWALTLHRAIGTRSMLLVIDDAWRVEDALALKVGGHKCTHLVTTRFPKIAAAVATDGAKILHELGEEESIALLKMLAPNVVDREEQQARDLVAAVGGLPLAIILMGNYLRLQAYSGQTRRIATAFAHLSHAEERLQISEPSAPIERHTGLPVGDSLSLQSVVAISDQQLNQQARSTLYALSVFPPKPSSFSEEAALAIANCAVDILDALFDAGLLESTFSGRYTLHQAIADYARLHLQDVTAYERFIAHFTTLAEVHKKDYELLEQESNLILATLETAYQLGKWETLVRCACAFAPFLLVRGIYAVAKQHLKRAYDAAMVLSDSSGMTTTLLYLGKVAQNQGNYGQAETYWQEGLKLAREMGDSERISALLNDLGWVMWKRGEYAKAESCLQEGLILARHGKDQERISSLLQVLGSVADSRGDYIKAEIYLQEGLALARLSEDRERICTMLINLGATLGAQGNYSQAEDYFREGLVLARQMGHREMISLLLSNLGATVVEQGNYSQAEDYFREGLELARQIEHREWTSFLLINLGMMARKQGDFRQADVYLQESLVLARSFGNPQIISTAFYEYGNLYLDQMQLKEAEGIFREMLSSIPEGDQELLALAQYGLARVNAAHGDIPQALKLGGISLLALRTIGHRNASEVQAWLDTIQSSTE